MTPTREQLLRNVVAHSHEMPPPDAPAAACPAAHKGPRLEVHRGHGALGVTEREAGEGGGEVEAPGSRTGRE